MQTHKIFRTFGWGTPKILNILEKRTNVWGFFLRKPSEDYSTPWVSSWKVTYLVCDSPCNPFHQYADSMLLLVVLCTVPFQYAKLFKYLPHVLCILSAYVLITSKVDWTELMTVDYSTWHVKLDKKRESLVWVPRKPRDRHFKVNYLPREICETFWALLMVLGSRGIGILDPRFIIEWHARCSAWGISREICLEWHSRGTVHFHVSCIVGVVMVSTISFMNWNNQHNVGSVQWKSKQTICFMID